MQILKPVKKWGSENLKPLMYFGNPSTLVKVDFYAPLPVGTRIRRTDLTYDAWKIKGALKTGTITRGMKISQIGMNVAGDDKYQIRMDSGEQIYLSVNKFS